MRLIAVYRSRRTRLVGYLCIPMAIADGVLLLLLRSPQTVTPATVQDLRLVVYASIGFEMAMFLNSRRAGTLRIWTDRLTFDSPARRRTFPKADVVAVTRQITPVRAWTRLCLELRDGRVVPLKGFATPRSVKSPDNAEIIQQDKIMKAVETWRLGKELTPGLFS